MYSRIFTPYERETLKRLLAGERDDPVWKMIHRLRKFTELRDDIALYMKASKAVPAKK